ncbi:hypothetical protein FOA52_007037 [Chlamydomonas sp. UWO 241]|nr:hypothetical protein FOA52_007037 [Chlamydomonas sp. UWO 241]
MLARRLEDGEQVVVKEVRVADMDQKGRLDALKEVKLLSEFDHVNIIHYYECVLEDGCLNIVMEYAGHGDLSDVVNKHAAEKRPLTEDVIMFWFVQVVLALYHVHSKNILHRDLKSQNIFIAEGNILKLGDFGIARVLSSDTDLASTVIGTPYYLSPEICEDRPYNRKSDIWSLGCLLYELCTLKHAFTGQCLPAVIMRILSGKYPPVPTRYPSHLRNLVDSMLKQDPKARPTVDAILRQAYVRSHVERYAQHVMALSPPEQQPSLGIDVRVSSSSSAPLGGADSPGRPSGAARRPAGGLPSRSTSAQQQPTPQRPSSQPSGRLGGPAQHGRRSGTPSGPVDGPLRTPPSGISANSPGRPAPRRRSSAEAAQGGNSRDGALSPAAARAAAAAAAGSLQHGRRQGSAGSGDGHPPRASPSRLSGGAPAAAAPGKGLVGATWIGRINAGLDELKAAAGALGGGGGHGDDPSSSSPDARRAPRRPGSGGPSAGSPPLGGGGGARAPSSGFVGAAPLHQQGAREGDSAGSAQERAAMRTQRMAKAEEDLQAQRRAVEAERLRKQAVTSRRSKEAATAVKQRERARGSEREAALLEQRAEVERRQARAVEAEQEFKAKLDGKRAVKDEIAAHLASHKAQMKSVRARVCKEDLAKMGAQFAARMEQSAASSSNGMQVVVPDSPKRLSAQQQQQQQQRAPRRPGSGAANGSPSRADGAGPSVSRSPSDIPPWKDRGAARSKSAANFPPVEIFTPFSAGPLPLPLQDAGPSARASPSSASAPGSHMPQGRPPAPPPSARPAGMRPQRSKMEVLSVLSNIQDVLDDSDSDGGGDEPDWATPGEQQPGPSHGGAAAAVHTRMHRLALSPEAGDSDGAARTASEAARLSSQKIEALRMTLETQLGPDVFLAGYRFLRDVQSHAAGSADGDGDDSGSSTEGLEKILGRKLGLARLIHKLIVLEDAVYSRHD